MIQKAMKVVMDHEDVAEDKQMIFHMLHESAFNEPLNTKRSACEQAGGKIVREAMAKMNPDEEFFTIEELCKLRRSTTEREMKAFYWWFFGSFLECICGKKAWGKAKFTSLVSIADESNNTRPAKFVTASDKAFALLLFDNYIDKWIEMAKNPPPKESQAEEAGTTRIKRKQRLTRGEESTQVQQQKVDIANLGDGTEREWHVSMNYFAMAREDRACPQANEMERKLLEFCNSTTQNADGDGTVAVDQVEAARILANLEPPVEAVWEDMEED
jgi:hypothetical protein